MYPNPPIWMSTSTTNLPKKVYESAKLTVCNPAVETAAAAVKKLSKNDTSAVFINGKQSRIVPINVYDSTVWAMFWCGVSRSTNREYLRMVAFKKSRVLINTFFQLIAIPLYYIKSLWTA